MSKSRIIAVVVGLAVLCSFGTWTVSTFAKDPAQKAKVEKLRKMFVKEKGKKGQDYAAESTAAVEGIGKGGIKVDDSEQFKKINNETKDKLYKESKEVKR